MGLDEKVTEVLDQVRYVSPHASSPAHLIAAFRWLTSSRSLPRLDEDIDSPLRAPDNV